MTASVGDIWRIYGLDVRAPWPMSRLSSSATIADLTIELHEPRPAPAEGLAGRLLGESRDGDRLREGAYDLDGEVSVLFPGVLEARFDAPCTVCHVHPDPNADPLLVQRLVASGVLASWMILTDRPVLHASAVEIGREAVMFVGGSGSGKSTIAAALVGVGAGAITDDVCRLEERDGRWVCHPDAGRVRLRAGSEDLAPMFPSEALARTDDRVVVTMPTADRPVPVAAIVIPRISRSAQVMTATRLRGTRSLVAVIEHPRMASLQGDEFSPALFRFASALVAIVPTWELTLPWRTVAPDLGPDLLAAVTSILDAS